VTARRRPLLGELLVRHGLISPAELTTALEKQQGTTKRLGEILVEMGAMSEADLTRMLELQNKPPGDENASQSDPDPGGETEAGIWVAVKVHGIFQATSIAGPKEHRYQLPRGARVRQLVELIGIAEQEVKRLLVNGRRARLDSMLREGDRVELFP